jgi:uncharacterized membrane protein YccC
LLVLNDYWGWLRKTLGLTVGGRIIFTTFALVGLSAVVGDAVFGGEHGDQAGGALAAFVGLALAIVVGLDAAYRRLRKVVRR